ncbi:transposase [Streptomyces sp. NPDC059168]|uniref:IS110 family transposase n=1 Tax=Streptomyces sp. NPDC059168 TaxID=3346753 RepID=UPI0036C5A98E
MAAARYRDRDRHVVYHKKSDHQDAVVLANILRTDVSLHRPLPSDSDLVKAIAVLARAQQDAVWDRTRAHNRLRSHLREYYPAILAAFATKRELRFPRDAECGDRGSDGTHERNIDHGCPQKVLAGVA